MLKDLLAEHLNLQDSKQITGSLFNTKFERSLVYFIYCLVYFIY